MVFVMYGGYLAVKGGIAAKQKIETRKNPTLDGDFIVAPLDSNKKEDLVMKMMPPKMKRSLSNLKQSIASRSTSFGSSISSITTSTTSISEELHSSEEDESTSMQFQMGQEVLLRNMKDDNLNGTRALIMQDFGGRKGVLVQFLEQKDGYNNYHETGSVVQYANVEPLPSAEQDSSCSNPIPIGTLVELQNLSAAHSQKNGLRGIVVQPANGMSGDRVAVQLLEGEQAERVSALVSVKPEKCKVVTKEEKSWLDT